MKLIQDTSENIYLRLVDSSVKHVSDYTGDDKFLLSCQNDLRKIASSPYFASDTTKANEFCQLLGETHFYLICLEKGVALERVPEQKGVKTPDFKSASNEFYFEVKTLSVVGGDAGIKKSISNILDTKICIEKQINEGSSCATGTTEVKPYGDNKKEKSNDEITTVIDTIISKIAQNIKDKQFNLGKTFLVVNLCIIPPNKTENIILRPYYCDDYLFSKAETGSLWAIAFSNPGMIICGSPDFEGKPCVKSISDKYGILKDDRFDFVAGILFMVYPWQKPAEIWGLYDFSLRNNWIDQHKELWCTLREITGDNWNDDKDTNGWKLS